MTTLTLDSNLAPIVLFVYNRPWHTRQTLEALAKNELAAESILYIYADGPKENASKEDLNKIDETRKLIKTRLWCKEVVIVEKKKNDGLAKSIVNGVTEIVSQFEKVIVLEDDIVSSVGFLKYMNDALDLYLKEEQVFHISAYMFPVKGRLPATFFYNTASCWGWGTWKRAWVNYNSDAEKLLNEIDYKLLKSKFNIEDSYDFYDQLKANTDGRLNTWAVKWYASFFLKNGLALHCYPSLINNIGHDGMGENCERTSDFNWRELAKSINVSNIPLTESLDARTAMRKFYSFANSATKNTLNSFFRKKIKEGLRPFIPGKLKHHYKLRRDQDYNVNFKIQKQLEEIAKIPRYINGKFNFWGNSLSFIDSASFIFTYDELFNKEIYKFKAPNSMPFVIDCGANIGLSIIYFKKLYPEAEIVAFEPDNKVFETLQYNIGAFNFSNVTLVNKACWNEETTLKFYSEGADGGRNAIESDSENLIEVKTTRLKHFLNRKIDFLKIDIEGAEFVVLNDCKDLLYNVENIFVEYHSFLKQEQYIPEILIILKNAGFRIHITTPGATSSSPFMGIRSYGEMDNQVNIYASKSNFFGET